MLLCFLAYNWFIKGMREVDLMVPLITPLNKVFFQTKPFYISASLSYYHGYNVHEDTKNIQCVGLMSCFCSLAILKKYIPKTKIDTGDANV